MNRSLRSKRNVSSKSVSKEWTSGQDFSFKLSPSPTSKKKPKEETNVRSKSVKDFSTASSRRKSVYLKRLESDFDSQPSWNSRRSTRKSTVNVSKGLKYNAQIPKTKSDTLISRKSSSRSNLLSPTIKLTKLKDGEQTLQQISSNEKEDKISKSNLSHKLSKLNLSSISNEKFYKISPLKTRQSSTRSKIVAYTKSSPKKEVKSLKRAVKSKTSSNSEQKEPQINLKSKVPTIVLKKPVKRLSTSTPSPRPIINRRLTRSAVKKQEKKVYIVVESPNTNAAYRKTPLVNINKINIESPVSAVKKFTVHKLKPFTPKPEEPLQILKQNLKKNVASEMKGLTKSDISNLLRPSIATVRTSTAVPLTDKKSPPKTSPKVTPTKNGIKTERFFSSPYHLPTTPLSSRKSSVSFRRYRGSVRLNKDDHSEKHSLPTALSLEKPLSSTPVKRKIRNTSSLHESEELMDISEFSASEESKHIGSFTESFSNNHSVEEIKEKAQEQDETSQQNKRSYCSLM